MFSNFKDAFVRKPQFTVKTPVAVLEAIGKDLPEGFSYIEDHDGFCRLNFEGMMTFSLTNVRVPDEIKTLLEANGKFTMNDVISYAYNAQKSIELLPDENGCFTVNEQKIKVSDFVKTPMKSLKLDKGKLILSVPPFPPAFEITVGGNGFTRILRVRRQAIDSITQVKIASVDENVLKVSYTINTDPENGNMQFNIAMCNSDSASDVLASKEIFNAFVNGCGNLCGVTLQTTLCDKSKAVPEEVLRFWYHIVEVEDALKIKFDVGKDITLEDIKLVNALHRCFIEKKPFKEYINDSTLKGTGEFNTSSLDDGSGPIGKELLFEYIEEVEYELLGVNIQYYILTDIYNGAISELMTPNERETGDFLVKMEPAKGKKMYSVKKFYIDIESANAEQENRDHVITFQNAMELELY